MIGRVVGNYKIVEKLGEGGMGTVYKALDLMVEREVAVKVLRPEVASQPDVTERFRTEAVTLAKLNHPAIATLFSFFRHGQELFMVIEYVPGRSLDALIRQLGPMPWERAVPLFAKALEGIEHAHQLGILHRDIKPANIMLTDAGAVKVTDFGIARALGTSRMTRTGFVVGTIGYMAPERIRGQEADRRSDIYSLGVVLYEMLTGRLPFESDSEWELMRAHIEAPPPPPSALQPGIPAALEAVVLRALAKNLPDRFQTAAEFRTALLGAAEATGAPPTRLAAAWDAVPAESPPTRLASSRLAPAYGPTRVAAAPPSVRRFGPQHYLAAAAGLTLVIAVAFLINSVLRPAGSAAPPATAGTGIPVGSALQVGKALQEELLAKRKKPPQDIWKREIPPARFAPAPKVEPSKPQDAQPPEPDPQPALPRAPEVKPPEPEAKPETAPPKLPERREPVPFAPLLPRTQASFLFRQFDFRAGEQFRYELIERQPDTGKSVNVSADINVSSDGKVVGLEGRVGAASVPRTWVAVNRLSDRAWHKTPFERMLAVTVLLPIPNLTNRPLAIGENIEGATFVGPCQSAGFSGLLLRYSDSNLSLEICISGSIPLVLSLAVSGKSDVNAMLVRYLRPR